MKLMIQSLTENKKKKLMNHFLKSHNALSLSYICEGQPEVCAVWYANDGLNGLYFLTSLTTKHGTTLQGGGVVAFTIHQDLQDWFEIQGIQGNGTVTLEGDLQGKGWKIYQEKFPFLRKKSPSLEMILKSAQLWKIMPSWLRLIDNSKQFGFKLELNLRN